MLAIPTICRRARLARLAARGGAVALVLSAAACIEPPTSPTRARVMDGGRVLAPPSTDPRTGYHTVYELPKSEVQQLQHQP